MAFINLDALKPGARPPPRKKKATEEQEYSYPELEKPVIQASQRTPRLKHNKFLEDATVEELQAQIEVLQGTVETEKKRAETAEKERRSSNAFLSNRMMSAILDAEQQNKTDAESYEGKIRQLEGVIRELEGKLEKTADLPTEETRGRAMSNYTQKMWKHLLDAEAETQDSQEKIKELEQENEMLRNELTQINSMRGRSFTEYSQRMWRHLLEAEHETTEQENKWKQKIQELETQLMAERQTVKQVERERRESVSDVSRKMFRHLLNAEEDARRDKSKDEQVIDELKTTIDQQNKEIDALKHLLQVERDRSQTIDRDRAGSIKFLSNQRMNDLLEAEQTFNEERAQWSRKVDLLEAELRLYQQQMALQQEQGEFVTPGGPHDYIGDPDDYDETPGGPNMTPGGPGSNVTPGGYDDDVMLRLAQLEEEVEYLRASKLQLIQNTCDEIDQLRTNLTTMGQHVSRSRRNSKLRSRKSKPVWQFW